ncbi:C-type lectin domain family 6 member A-like [Stylophora pistillata]|uniref:C-type lectin domain family 6 member A-like n=1 Tax=Stylophora pistillata TaxID=50429 RepID=UPI000C04E8EC|nr:C-type lectin domain family 6 member A-like [Stylophora pistillata]
MSSKKKKRNMNDEKILRKLFIGGLCNLFVITFGVQGLDSHSAVQDNVEFIFYNDTTTWDGGQERCKENGGYLVTLETTRKWEFISQEIRNLSCPRQDEWYIGLHFTGQNWTWINGEPATESNLLWQPREPSGDGKCVVIAKEYPSTTYGKYNDLSCETYKGFICEVKLPAGKNRLYNLSKN